MPSLSHVSETERKHTRGHGTLLLFTVLCVFVALPVGLSTLPVFCLVPLLSVPDLVRTLLLSLVVRDLGAMLTLKAAAPARSRRR